MRIAATIHVGGRDPWRLLADVMVATMALWTWVLFAAINTCAPARIEFMAAWEAQRPFVTRALVPGMIRLGEAALPDLSWLIEFPLVAGTLRAYTLDFVATPPTQGILAFAIMLGFTFLAVRAMRALLAETGLARSPTMQSLLAWSAPLTLLVLMHSRGLAGRPFMGMIYDPAALGLTALALAVMAANRWGAYLAVFAIAAINRETAVYLIPVFCLYGWWQLPRRKAAILVGAQVGLFVAIRGALELAALHLPVYNPGIKLIIFPASAFLPVGGETVAVVLMLSLFVAARLLADGFALAALVMVPVAVVAYLIAGEPGEYRVFLELAPVAILSAAVVGRAAYQPGGVPAHGALDSTERGAPCEP